MLIKRKYSRIDSVLSLCIILMGIFFYNCENTITDIPVSINYGVVINEINYLSFNDFPEDWVELHNPTNKTIAIGLWTLKDNNDDHVFTIPENIILSSNDFVVLCKDITAFENLFPEVNNSIGDLGFGLGGGDQIRLFDSNGLLVDKVKYDEEDPWPIHPDGTVFTLAPIHPSLDNGLAENWNASIGNGTPGEINSIDDE